MSWASVNQARMKLLLWCAWAASLHGAAAEPLPNARAGLPSLGPNFAAAVDQVLDLSYVEFWVKDYLKICRDDDDFFFKKSCHDTLVDVLSLSKEQERNATRECERTCADLDRPLAGYSCIEPCKEITLGDAYGRWEADRKILMAYLGIKQTVWGGLDEAVSTLGQNIHTLIGYVLLALINLGLIALPFKLIDNPRYCLAAVNVWFAAVFVEMCLFCPYMVIMLTTLIMWFLFCDWIFGFKHLSEDEADDLGFLGTAREIFTRVIYTLSPLAAAVVVAYALGL